jgi:uncharacterized protein
MCLERDTRGPDGDESVAGFGKLIIAPGFERPRPFPTCRDVFTEEARMNPQERQLVDELFDRLAKLESAPRDADAAAAINQGLAHAPNAIYPLVQTVLLQDEALKRAAARIEELEAQASGQQQESQGGFLDSMRGAIFGQQQKGGSVPSVRPAEQSRPVWNTGGGAYQAAPAAPPMPQADPRAQGGGFGGGGSFLGTAAAAAVGMIGGSMLMNSIGGLMGGHRQGFGDASSMDRGGSGGGSPWTGDQSKGDLAREAGVNDVGRGGGGNERDADAGGRQGFVDQASNEDHHGDDEDYDSDGDFDSGDSDYA